MPVPNQQILLPYSFWSFSDNVPPLFGYSAFTEEILSHLKLKSFVIDLSDSVTGTKTSHLYGGSSDDFYDLQAI